MAFIYEPQHVFPTVKTERQYAQLQQMALDRANTVRADDKLSTYICVIKPPVYINHGRLVLMCPCGSAVSVSRTWNIGRCLACGAVHQDPVWPSDLDEIIKVLLLRPKPFRNWRPGETLELLVADNATHKVGI